uniref:Uncharacterized protein n=1 Tax=Sander lucioperca TaxID=283035 RepID=A0A8C9XLU0_SANLU
MGATETTHCSSKLFLRGVFSPLTKVKLINELNAREASLGVKESVSWHSEYKDSAWVFVGGFPYELTEGDIICVFSQYVYFHSGML